MSYIKPPGLGSKFGTLPNRSHATVQNRLIPRAAEEGDRVERASSDVGKAPPTLTDALDLASRPSRHPISTSNRIDWLSAKQWLLLNADQALPAAKAVLRNIERVSQEHFDNVFAHGVQTMVKQKQDARPLLALQQVATAARKSNQWMTERAQQLAPELLDGVLEVLPHTGEISPYLISHHRHQVVDLVLFDDASYSGSQAASLIASAIESAELSGTKIGAIFVVLGCATQHALKKILSPQAAEAADMSKVTIIGQPIRMRTLSDLIADGAMSKDDLAVLKRRIPELRATRTNAHPENELTLTYLPHKVPDGVSSLNSILADGAGLEPRPGVDIDQFVDGIPFIPATIPPYKK